MVALLGLYDERDVFKIRGDKMLLLLDLRGLIPGSDCNPI